MAMKMANAIRREAVSLENCDKEPVHIPGHIQGFAVMIAADPDLKFITHCSENISTLFDKAPSAILGAKLSELFDAYTLHALNNTLSLGSSRVQRERVTEWVHVNKETGENEVVEMWAHFSGDIPIIELEAAPSHSFKQSKSIMIVRSLLGHLGQVDSLSPYLNDAVLGLRNLSGFDRVLLYQFDSNGDGEVKAEACGPHMEPFLGLRFPKWDIPNQAREIMKKLPLRMIADIGAAPIAILASDETLPPLDMTYAASRGTSPIHVEYLKNMGVGGSMTLSIVIGGKLWGLFAFHHNEPRRIDPGLRGAAELFVQFFALQIEQKFETIRNQIRSNILSFQSDLLSASNSVGDINDLIKDVAKPFCKLLEADGLVSLSKDKIYQYGVTPDPNMARKIVSQWLVAADEDIAFTTHLKGEGFDVSRCAGAIGFVLDREAEHYIVFFRQKAKHSINWAGAPEKDIVDTDTGSRLLPRSSFKAFSISIIDKCLPWEDFDLLTASEIRKTLVKADASLLRRLSYKQERQRSLYIAELNHRVRNILALIQSLSRRAKESSHSLEAYALALEQRITALGVAHDLAANRIMSGVSIRELFETELRPYLLSRDAQASITGEEHILRPDIAPTFALIAHELVTNCVRHGALSRKTGKVFVSVKAKKLNGTEGVEITWTEQGGPPVETPKITGFGLGLIENSVPYELDGESELIFAPEGLIARFWIPSTLISRNEDRSSREKDSVRDIPAPMDGIPRSVLVLEDRLMVAMDMSHMLKKMGVDNVQIYPTLAQARRGLKASRPDFALLDISLRDTLSFDFAEELQGENIPFCFASGYTVNNVIPEKFQNIKLITKPVKFDVLAKTLKDLYLRASK